ncbi:MAG: hypothetical protein ABFS08_05845 [Pseudomonadota bacterium]
MKERTKGKNPFGEFTISIEWSWRIENKNSIILGSWSEDHEIDAITKILNGLTIKNISFFARLKEIEVELSKDRWLTSFATEKGDPQWSIKNNDTWLYFKSGRFVSE